jgi:predicted dehydrogenase
MNVATAALPGTQPVCGTQLPSGTQLASRTRPAASVRPRLGFVGVGWIGANRMRFVAESACAEIVALADVRPDVANAAAQSIAPVKPALRSFEDLLDSDLDGIVIATPNADHLPQCLAALDRGVSVFCQKPLARTRTEVARILQRASEKNRLLATDFCYRHVAGVPELKTRIRTGAIGKIYAADLTFHNAYGPDKPWFFDARSVGGGCFMDLGIHLIDLLLWATDYPTLQRVSSRLYRNGELLPPPFEQLEDYATAELLFSSGLTARLACSWHLSAGQDAVIEATFFGTEGAVRLRNLNGSFYDFVVEQYEGTRTRTLSEPSRDWGGVGICNWVKQLATNPGFDPEAGRIEDVHRILDEVYRR